MKHFELLLRQVEDKGIKADTVILKKAKDYAERFFPIGEAMEEPLRVAQILTDYSAGEDVLIAAILLKCTELEKLPSAEIEAEFGRSVSDILSALHRLLHLSKVAFENKANHTEILRQMFLALAQDVRVVFLKLANRLYSLENIPRIDPKNRLRFAQEVFELYGPIAARLGIYRMKRALEDRAFSFLYPYEYQKICTDLQQVQKDHSHLLTKGKSLFAKLLKKQHIPGEIYGRVKDPYSISQKLKRKEASGIEDIHDLFAFRIIVETIPECYTVLGLIHQNWKVLSVHFKDYIATPKPNGYMSLHTVILGDFVGKKETYPVEVQIRTKEMHERSEFGSAVHWHYKEKKGKEILQVNWFAELARVSKDLNSAENFEIFAKEFLGDRIFVLTEKGDVKILPDQATPIDFAYAIHTEIGQHCQGAVINGKISPLSTKLENGDVVKILTNKKIFPKDSWLSLAASPSARQKIRTYLHRYDTGFFIREGKRKLNAALKQLGLPLLDTKLSFLKFFQSEKPLDLKERETILRRIGIGDMSGLVVAKKITPLPYQKKQTLPSEKQTDGTEEQILVSEEKGYQTRKARCCGPKSGEAIVAFTTRGGSFTIHKAGCKATLKLDAARFLPARWESELPPEKVLFRILGIQETSPAELVAFFLRNGLSVLDVRKENSKMTSGILIDAEVVVKSLPAFVEKLRKNFSAKIEVLV